MRDFLDAFDHELRTLAVDPQVYLPERRPAWWRRLLGGAAGLLVVGGSVIALTGPSTANPPVLDGPVTSAQRLAQEWEGYRTANIDLSKAHVFATPDGPGYAFERKDGQAICIVVPLGDDPGTWGGSCTPIEQARRDGVFGATIGKANVDPSATSSAYYVLPPRATGVVVTEGGRRVTARVDHGVVARQFTEDGSISFTVDGRRVNQEVAGVDRSTTTTIDCGGGRFVQVPLPAGTPAEIEAGMAKARKERC